MPSPYESLSIVLLEAWNRGTPALVNGDCAVLRGQALRSDGALYYRTYDEFAHAVEHLLRNPAVSRQLGQNGLAYVEREYRWPVVMGKLEKFLARALKASTKTRNHEKQSSHENTKHEKVTSPFRAFEFSWLFLRAFRGGF